jgi:HAD superfamily hydrolase (TIGR01509 family)
MAEINLAILWDMDGTIIDSKAVHFSSWQYALRQHGFELDSGIFNDNFGRNNNSILPLFLGFDPAPDLFDQITDVKETHFREIAPVEANLFPGVESWLKDVKEMGVPQIVASSASMENIQVLLKSFNLLPYFNLLISGEDLPSKPAPDVFIKAASAIEHSPSSCLVIEDSLSGIMAAKQAGMTCIAVATTHHILELTSADLVVEDFRQSLADVLGDLNLH